MVMMYTVFQENYNHMIKYTNVESKSLNLIQPTY